MIFKTRSQFWNPYVDTPETFRSLKPLLYHNRHYHFQIPLINTLHIYLDPPEKLVANCKIVLKLSHILSHIVRIVAPGVLLLLMFFEPGLKPFLGSGLFIVSSKGGHLCIVVVQAWAFFSMCGPMTYFMFIFLCDSLHCAVEHLCYLKR